MIGRLRRAGSARQRRPGGCRRSRTETHEESIDDSVTSTRLGSTLVLKGSKLRPSAVRAGVPIVGRSSWSAETIAE